MTNYCTDQNLIVTYPHGAAGKFFLTCLSLFDEIACWSPQVQHNKLDFITWVENCWPEVTYTWVKYEPNQPWGISFYSRTHSRGNELSCDQYNKEVQANASDYFFECWNNGLTIIDHFHKRTVPDFHQSAKRIEILVTDECMLDYQKMVREKLWSWDDANKVGISLLDLPELAHNEVNKGHRLKFNNPVHVAGYNSFEELFENHILNLPSIKPFVNVEPDLSTITSLTFSDIVNCDRFVSTMNRFEDYFGQKLDTDKLVELQTLWAKRSKLI